MPLNYVPLAWFILLLLGFLVFTRHKGTVRRIQHTASASRTGSSVMLRRVSSASSSPSNLSLRLCSVGPPESQRDHMNFCTRCRSNTLANLPLARATNRWTYTREGRTGRFTGSRRPVRQRRTIIHDCQYYTVISVQQSNSLGFPVFTIIDSVFHLPALNVSHHEFRLKEVADGIATFLQTISDPSCQSF